MPEVIKTALVQSRWNGSDVSPSLGPGQASWGMS
jgi:hypothetical protein